MAPDGMCTAQRLFVRSTVGTARGPVCRRALAAAVGKDVHRCGGAAVVPYLSRPPFWSAVGDGVDGICRGALLAMRPPEWPHSDKSVDGFHQARDTTAFRYRRCFRVCIPACQGLLVPGGLFFLALSCYGGNLLLHHLSPQTKVRLAGAAIDAFDTGTYLAAALAACAFCVLV